MVKIRILLFLLSTFQLLTFAGDHQIVHAHTGDEVTLPCRARIDNISTVNWTTSQFETSGKEEYVCLHRDGNSTSRNQHPNFVSRVGLLDSQMKDGNLSIFLRNVTPNDTGTYTCQYKDSEGRSGSCTVSLEVKDSGLRTVHADAGSKVTLTFQAPSNITVFSVYLKILGHDKYVYYCKDEQPIKPHDQEPDLQGRVELANALTCNMSLNSFAIILKNVMQNDNNTYECVFKDSEGKTWNDTRFLIVTNREEPVGGTWRIMVGIAIGIFIAIGVCLYKRHKGKQTDRGSSSEDPEKTSQDTDDSDDAAKVFLPEKLYESFHCASRKPMLL